MKFKLGKLIEYVHCTSINDENFCDELTSQAFDISNPDWDTDELINFVIGNANTEFDFEYEYSNMNDCYIMYSPEADIIVYCWSDDIAYDVDAKLHDKYAIGDSEWDDAFMSQLAKQINV